MRCSLFGRKKAFFSRRKAGKTMMRIWSHDPGANIYDLHVYECPDTRIGRHWHIGHRSYFERGALLKPERAGAGDQNGR